MDIDEQQHFLEVIEGFVHYKEAMNQHLSRKEHGWEVARRAGRVPDELYEKMEVNFKKLREAVETNAQFLREVADPARRPFESQEMDNGYGAAKKWGEEQKKIDKILNSSAFDRNYSKTKSTFSQLVRDWGDEGEEERATCYGPIVEEMERRFEGVGREERVGITVLVPGSGLGRLPWEIAMRGFAAQGNEFSYQMLLASNHIFNVCGMKKGGGGVVYPYIHSGSNHVKREDMLRGVEIPNVVINDPMLCREFSTNAGEFLEIYGDEPEKWDVVATCFFLDTANNPYDYIETIFDILKPGGVWINIDTANNPYDYIETIFDILKPGGVWINIGPLLYHYEDSFDEISLELSFDEVMGLIKEVGFKVNRVEEKKCFYTRDREGMMSTIYPRCQFFVCEKEKKEEK